VENLATPGESSTGSRVSARLVENVGGRTEFSTAREHARA
jgi:hypothetical protein